MIPYEKTSHKQFCFIVREDGSVYPNYQTFPKEYGEILNYYLHLYNSPKKLDKVINQIKEHQKRKDNKECLGSNETTFIVEKEFTTFDVQYVSGYKPLKISTESALQFFERYKDWIVKFEKGQILGLNKPKSKEKFYHEIIGEQIKNKITKTIIDKEDFDSFENLKNSILYFRTTTSSDEQISRQKVIEVLNEFQLDNLNFYFADYNDFDKLKKEMLDDWIRRNNRDKSVEIGRNGELFYVEKGVIKDEVLHPHMHEKKWIRFKMKEWKKNYR